MENDITRDDSFNICNKDHVQYNSQSVLDSFEVIENEKGTMLKKKQWTMFENNRSQNTSEDCSSNTLGAMLRRFGKLTLLRKLDESLEDVKKNIKTPEDHNQLVRTEDKELKNMSRNFHPDHAGNASNFGTTVDGEMQSALNATRTVIKILTRTFLEKISVEYRYEYFSKLHISLLANEEEIQKRIQAVLYKICTLSEIKRMNIVGEIRKFLMECQNTVTSYLRNDRYEFEKNRDHVLHHLQKNVEGYNKFVEECRILVEECIEENDKNMGSVIESVMTKSLNESHIVRKLESIANSSFRGKFKIFAVDKSVDKYYILPFVYYVNALSMCNLLLLSKSCSCMPFLHGSLSCGPVRDLFSKAYNLAFDIYHRKHFSMLDNLEINSFLCKTWNAKEDLNEMLGGIFKILEEEFKLDNYKEGKSNKTEMHEELMSLKKVVQDLEEKEKTFRELLSQTVKDRRENWKSQKMKVSEINDGCSIHCDENVREKYATPDPNCRTGATGGFTNQGNLSQENESGWDSISKRGINEKKFGKVISQRKCMEQLPENSGTGPTMNEGISGKDEMRCLYDLGI